MPVAGVAVLSIHLLPQVLPELVEAAMAVRRVQQELQEQQILEAAAAADITALAPQAAPASSSSLTLTPTLLLHPQRVRPLLP